MKCNIRQYSDMMQCHTCGLIWDANDPYPPECLLIEITETKLIKIIWWFLFGCFIASFIFVVLS